jgi:hypothetical protein
VEWRTPFESICEDRLCAWMRAKNKGMKTSVYLLFPVSRFDTIHEIWMTVAARRKAAWEARALASMSGCSNPFADKAKAPGSGRDASLDGADSSSSSGSGRVQRSMVQTHQAAPMLQTM